MYSDEPSGRTGWTDSEGRTTTYKKTSATGSLVIRPDGTRFETMTFPQPYSTGIMSIDPNGFRTSSAIEITDDNKIKKLNFVVNSGGGGVTGEGGEYVEETIIDATTGLKESETTPAGTTNYSYDGWGNLTVVSSNIPDRNDVSYEYDQAGNIVRINYPDGTSVSRELDAAGRVIKITDWAGVQYTIGYNANGDMDSVTMSNGLSYTTQYDGSRAVKKEWMNSAGQVIAAFESTHDSSGILSSDTKTVDANTDQRSFSWGDSGQLTGVNGNSVGWNGKRVTSTPQLKALSYNPTSGRLDSVTRVDDSVVSFDYDLFGNRIAKNEGGTSTHYSWNSLNQLTGVDDTTYSYGADGMRSSINGKQQMYGQDLKLMSDGENKYLWGVDGSLLTQAPLGSVDEAESLHALTDKMGSVYGMVKSELVPGTVDQHEFVLKAQYSYSAFGERNLVSGNDVTVMGFVSEQHDDTGFIYLRARYYDPSTAQFISLDPMVSMTLDPYGYANGNPLQIIDPLGLWGWNPMDWTADEWGTVGTWAGRIGAFAAVATVTFASGGTALIIAGAISGVATGVSTSVGVSQTTQSCRQGITTKCVTQAGTTALGMVPLLKPVKALRVKANSEINWNESSVPSPQAHNARRFNQKIGYSAISSSSSIVGTINSAVAGC